MTAKKSAPLRKTIHKPEAQFERFLATEKALGADTSDKALGKALKKIAPRKSAKTQ